jgi:anti-sigma28 factor (negative regulator of flagellin synthesis)
MNPQLKKVESNTELLRSYLPQHAKLDEVSSSIDQVLNQRVEEVRRVIADGKTELG